MDLTPGQAAKLRDSVRSRPGFFHAVTMRMYQRGVGTDDPLFLGSRVSRSGRPTTPQSN